MRYDDVHTFGFKFKIDHFHDKVLGNRFELLRVAPSGTPLLPKNLYTLAARVWWFENVTRTFVPQDGQNLPIVAL